MNFNFESLSIEELQQVNGGASVLSLEASYIHGFVSTKVSDVVASATTNVLAEFTSKKIKANYCAFEALIIYLDVQKGASEAKNR